jgi:hypothetical protein
MIKRFPILILLQLLWFFSAATCLAAQPIWVRQRPNLPDHYVGIGMVAKKDGPQDYRQRVRANALFDLSQEISVAVAGTFVQKIVEKTGLSEQTVRSEIRLSSQARISGYELVDQWEARGVYWVYYRLSRQRFHKELDRSRAAALRSATDMWRRAVAAGDNRQIVSALRFDYEALQKIVDFLGDPLEIEVEGRLRPLVNEIYTHLQGLLAAMHLSSRQSSFPFLVGQTTPDVLPVLATFIPKNHDPVAVAQLPLRFTFPWRPDKPAEIRYSDTKGIARCSIDGAKAGDDGMDLAISVDAKTLFPSPGVFLRALLGRLGWPRTSIRLKAFHEREDYLWHREFQGRKVAVLTAFQVDGQTGEWPKFFDEMGQHLSGLGAKVLSPASGLSSAQVIQMARQPDSLRSSGTLAKIEIVMVMTAHGKLNRRENKQNPFGEDVQFAGELRSVVQKRGAVTFSDRYRAMSGWNPMGAKCAWR